MLSSLSSYTQLLHQIRKISYTYIIWSNVVDATTTCLWFGVGLLLYIFTYITLNAIRFWGRHSKTAGEERVQLCEGNWGFQGLCSFWQNQFPFHARNRFRNDIATSNVASSATQFTAILLVKPVFKSSLRCLFCLCIVYKETSLFIAIVFFQICNEYNKRIYLCKNQYTSGWHIDTERWRRPSKIWETYCFHC